MDAMHKTATLSLVLIIIFSMHHTVAMQPTKSKTKESVALAAYKAAQHRKAARKKQAQSCERRTQKVIQELVRDPMIMGCYGATAVIGATYAYLKLTQQR